MHYQASHFQHLPIVSLQTSEVVAFVKQPLIDPSSLGVLAYVCLTSQSRQSMIICLPDIRHFLSDCLIINHQDDLIEATDVIRLSAFIKQDYTPLRKTVICENGDRLGHVRDYTIDSEASWVQKLYTTSSFWHAWTKSFLIIDRSQVVEVTPRQIIVQEATNKLHAIAPRPLPGHPQS